MDELADDEGHGLVALDLLLGAEELVLEALVLILDVLLLDLDELDLVLEGLRAGPWVTNTKIEWMKLEDRWFRLRMRNIDLWFIASVCCVDAE